MVIEKCLILERSFQIIMPKVETFNRDQVILNAINVFHDKGFNATSMQDLVDATGLNRSSIYNSFGSKLDLFLECLNVYQYKYQQDTSEVLLHSNTGYDAIQNIFLMYLEDIIKDKDSKGCMITNSKSEMANHCDRITGFLKVNQKQTLDLLAQLINKGQNDGSINTNQTSENYALYLFSALQGIRMTSILENDEDKLEALVNTSIDILT